MASSIAHDKLEMVTEREKSLPPEFDLRPPKIGFTMRGWDFSRHEISNAIEDHRMLNPAMELGTNVCPWNCTFCFTEHPNNPAKRRLKNELSIERRLRLIDEGADLGARSINLVGAGEPTIDPDFWRLIDRMVERDVTPIVYTEGTLRLMEPDFVKRLFASGSTVVLKVNSLVNQAYQNAIVLGGGKNANAAEYTNRRNKVIDLLIEEGFADCEPTRLAFDTIVTRQNIGEIFDIHRFSRRNNIFVLFVNYLPAGRSSDGISDALTRVEQFEVFEEFARIDAEEFGVVHDSKFPYAGGIPCSIRGTGLFIKITGKVYDCPGELISLGDLEHDSLAAVWDRARRITGQFDGGCAPREEFWKGHAAGLTQISREKLPVAGA